MTLGRTVVVVPGMIEEYRAFSGLLLDGMEEFPVSGEVRPLPVTR